MKNRTCGPGRGKNGSCNGWTQVRIETCFERSSVKQQQTNHETNYEERVRGFETKPQTPYCASRSYLMRCKCEADQSGCLCFQIFWSVLQIWVSLISAFWGHSQKMWACVPKLPRHHGQMGMFGVTPAIRAALRSWRVGIWEFRLFPNWSQNSWIARAPSCQVSAASPWMFITVEQMSWFLLFNHLETSWQPECVRRFQVEMASDLFRCSTWRNGVTNKTTGSDLLGTRQFET